MPPPARMAPATTAAPAAGRAGVVPRGHSVGAAGATRPDLPCCSDYPLAACRHHYPRQDQAEAFVVRPKPWLRPSPSVRRVGSCKARFRGLHGVHMCCTKQSRHGITARWLAEWLNHPLTPKASYGFVTSTATSAASGWNDKAAGWVSHPRDNPNLCTAHAPKVRKQDSPGQSAAVLRAATRD